MKVFLNDKLIETEDARIPAGDSGFLYGAGLFETMRAYNSTVFRLDDHLSRLLSSAKALSIEHQYSKEHLTANVYEVLKANVLTEARPVRKNPDAELPNKLQISNGARLRLTLSAGVMSQSQEKSGPTLLITAASLQPYPANYYSKGVLVVLCPSRQNVSDPTCGHKTTSYFSRMLALKQAHLKKASEALWFTTDGRLAEGCISNVFLVKDSKIFTPTTNTPVLPGIARKTVCELAIEGKIELVEKDLSIDDLLGADEVFITNVIMQVMPVVGIEKHNVGEGKPGHLTRKITELYDQFVIQSCQIK